MNKNKFERFGRFEGSWTFLRFFFWDVWGFNPFFWGGMMIFIYPESHDGFENPKTIPENKLHCSFLINFSYFKISFPRCLQTKRFHLTGNPGSPFWVVKTYVSQWTPSNPIPFRWCLRQLAQLQRPQRRHCRFNHSQVHSNVWQIYLPGPSKGCQMALRGVN